MVLLPWHIFCLAKWPAGASNWHKPIIQVPALENKSYDSDAQSYLTLCDTMDCRSPGSSVHVCMLQERVLEWGVISSLGNLHDPGTEPTSLLSPALAGGFFTTSATWEPPTTHKVTNKSNLLIWLLQQPYNSFPWLPRHSNVDKGPPPRQPIKFIKILLIFLWPIIFNLGTIKHMTFGP